MNNAIPTIEVEELHIQEHVVLSGDDYSWYEIHGELCLCIVFDSPADNNWDCNYWPCPTGEHMKGHCPGYPASSC
jgi:hypothetical protein